MAQISRTSAIITTLCVLSLALAQVAHSAPTDFEPTSTTEAGTSASSSTTPAPAESSTKTITETPESKETTSASPAGAQTPVPEITHSNFTCYGRNIGYYADMSTECKIYHFCVLGDYNGEPVYQRISYYCLNDTVFDQQALDCVQKISAPCADSEKYYEESNKVLRQAVHSTNSNSTTNHQ